MEVKKKLPDLYKILGLTKEICSEPNCDELINKAYLKKAKMCHPDKCKDDEAMNELFLLLTESYEILGNEKSRNEYNEKVKNSVGLTDDFNSLKAKAKEYYHMMEGEVRIIEDYHGQQSAEQKVLQQVPAIDITIPGDDSAIDRPLTELDKYFEFNPLATEPINVEKITTDEFNARMRELNEMRVHEQNNYGVERIFEGDNFDIDRFNQEFEKKKKEKDFVPSYTDSNEIMPYDPNCNCDAPVGYYVMPGNKGYSTDDFMNKINNLNIKDYLIERQAQTIELNNDNVFNNEDLEFRIIQED